MSGTQDPHPFPNCSQDSIIPSPGGYAKNLADIVSNSIIPTYVGESMIAGSTRDVIWSTDYNYNMKINNCVECRFNSFNSNFNVFEKVDGVRPKFLTYYSGDIRSLSNIYGDGTGSIKCLKINTNQIDKKIFEELTNKQCYLVVSSDSSDL